MFLAMRLGVLGAGHVGLPTGAALAHSGHDVWVSDIDTDRIDSLRQGVLPFQEQGLDALIQDGMDSGRLSFVPGLRDHVPGTDVVFICVGTPPRSSGEANLLALESSAAALAEQATGDLLVVEKSTVPLGSAERLRSVMKRHNPSVTFRVASNPEFLKEGNAVDDSLNPSRILVGADSERAHEIMRDVYRPLIERGVPYIEADLRTAELAKHASNAFLSLKISYMNAVARLCEKSGADVVKIAEVMGADARIAPQFLNAGLGYGGFCFPKDVAAFDRLSSRWGYDFPMLREITRINDEVIDVVVQKAEGALWNLEGKRIALLGMSFKPGTDDIRYAPALILAERLLNEGAAIVGYDPEAGDNVRAEHPRIEVEDDVYDAIAGAHCLVLCTEWPEFEYLDLDRAKATMKYPIVIDGRNQLDPERMRKYGFTYLPMGRPPVQP